MAVRPLVITVDAQIDPLKRAMAAGKATMIDFGASAEEMAREVQKRMQEMAASPVASVAAMQKAVGAQIAAGRRQADAVLRSGASAADGSFTSQSSLEAAESMDKLAAAERIRAAAAIAATAADEKQTMGLKSVAVAATVTAEHLEQQSAALREQAVLLGLVEAEQERLGMTAARTGTVVARSSGMAQAGMQQLSFQVGDVATQFAMGTPPMMIFAMQATQVTQAVGMMTAGSKGFIAFLGSPWGLAIIAGITVLGALATQMDVFTSEAEKNAKALEKVKAADDGVSRAQSLLGDMFDLTTGKMEHQNEVMRLRLRLLADQLRGEALLARTSAEKTFTFAEGITSGVSAKDIVRAGTIGLPSDLVGPAFRAGQVRALAEQFSSGKVGAEDAQKAAKSLDFSGLSIDRATFTQALLDARTAPDKEKLAAAIDKTLDTNTLDPSLRKDKNKKKGGNEYLRQVRSDAAYASALDQANSEQLRQQLDLNEDPAARAGIQKQIIAAELQRLQDATRAQAIEQKWSAGKTAALLTQQDSNALMKAQKVDEDLKKELLDKELGKKAESLELQATLLGIDGQLAPTMKERLRIALALLEIDRKHQLNQVDRDFNNASIDPADAERKRAAINQTADANKAVVRDQNKGPLDSYRDQLKRNVGDMDTALEGVAVHGLQSLEDGLTGLLTGTESVASAFKKMAASIIADLARIAIQKLIFKALGLGFAGGDVPGHATGMIPGFAAGTISGPGTGTSDNILAWHDGKGLIRVSNGESIITAEGTRKHRGLLQAINDNRLPAFAAGDIGGMGHVSWPALPSASSLRISPNGTVQQHFFVNAQGAVMADSLMAEMRRIGTVTLAAAPSLTRQELSESQAQAIPS